jgi:3-hydroxyacyl-[acyl-carrier-protein] dehydratase
MSDCISICPHIDDVAQSVVSFETVRELLVHRFPFLMIDKVIYFDNGKRLDAVKNVTGNEIHFLGHFPQHAIMPGVLVVEAMAQAMALLCILSRGADRSENSRVLQTWFLANVDVRFYRPVVPGDQLHLEASLIRALDCGAVATVIARTDDIVAKGDITLAGKQPGA